MNKEISQMINSGYKVLKFERNVDLLTNEEYGSIEVKALDGYTKNINISSDQADGIERVLFKYLEKDL